MSVPHPFVPNALGVAPFQKWVTARAAWGLDFRPRPVLGIMRAQTVSHLDPGNEATVCRSKQRKNERKRSKRRFPDGDSSVTH